MHNCFVYSQHGFLFFLPRRSSQKDRQYMQHDVLMVQLDWYGPSYGTISQWLGLLSWGLPWLHPGGAERVARQWCYMSRQLCCCYGSNYLLPSCSAYIWVCNREQQPARPLQWQKEQLPQHHQHHLHDQHWESGIKQWNWYFPRCDVAWTIQMVSFILLRIWFVGYFIVGFVDIS